MNVCRRASYQKKRECERNMSTVKVVVPEGPSRWAAASRIQRQWRRALASVRVTALLDARRAAEEARFAAADRNEAVLLIQNRMRICLAKNRVAAVRADQASRGTSRTHARRDPEYVHPSKLESSLFVFKSQPPSDDEVLDLFDAIDITNSVTIPRAYARAVFDRLLVDLFPGNADAAFERAIPIAGDAVPPSALYFLVLRALAL